ncbi:MAG: DUF2207 domain-containing protein [bacterium]|nr:DUF2207 domain-containing protein [bacterium]
MNATALSRKLSLLAAAALCTASANGQIFVETYDNGSNEGDYEIWFAPYNTVETSGGNPGGYLHLDNVTSGPATCQFIKIFPNQWPNALSGDYRALGVDRIAIDVNLVFGPQMVPGTSTWILRLFDDNGTPMDDSDDCAVFLMDPSIPLPTAPGWTTIEFPIPSGDTSLPTTWGTEGTTCAGNNDVTWNAIIQDVDYVEIELNADPAVFCAFNDWDFGLDNFSLFGGGPIGTPYCITLPNSTGNPATLTGQGSIVVSANSVNFDVTSLPQNQFGYFLMGENQAQIPVAQGFLCIGNPQVRFNGFILNSGAAGEASFSPDLTNLPQMTQILPGETWNWQMWYRDQNPTTTSNFSSPLAIQFM